MRSVVLCGAVLLGLAVEAMAGSVVLDQYFVPTDSGGSLITNGPETVGGYKKRTWAQSFTAGLTGTLDSVDLYLLRFETADDLVLNIHRIPGSQEPRLSTSVGSLVIPGSDVRESSVFYGGAGNGAWTTVDLTSLAIDVTAGERLAVSLEKEAGDDGAFGWFTLQVSPSNQHLDYVGGNAFHFRYLWEPADMFFRTYVDVTAVPLPAAAWAGLALLGGLGALRRVRRRRR